MVNPSHLMHEHHQLPQVQLVQHPYSHQTLTTTGRNDYLSRAVVRVAGRPQQATSSAHEPLDQGILLLGRAVSG